VATYVRDRWSPLGAKCDCLGGGESDLDREGRCAAPQLASGRPGLLASVQSSPDTSVTRRQVPLSSSRVGAAV